jgi:two-component system response regulator HydG
MFQGDLRSNSRDRASILKEEPEMRELSMSTVLIVDDDEAFTSGLAEYVRRDGHTVRTANSVSAARQALDQSVPSLLLLDLMLPDGNGLDVLEELKTEPPRRVVLITGHPGVKTFVRGMIGDRTSYLTKPVEPRDVIAIVNALGDDEEPTSGPLHFDLIIGECDAMQMVYRQIRQVAPTDSTVLVLGESGTGKELVAEAIHRESRRSGHYVPVNCGGLSADLVASELFGHERGSFTGANRRHVGFFERAGGGTLFLDEITEMPLGMQAQLLRVLETGRVLRVGGEGEIEVDARIVAASNRDPHEAIRDEQLREDLYFRLSVFPIELPPLRERGDDVDRLANAFLGELNQRTGTGKVFAPDALTALRQHHWPGNVRELKHVVNRMFIMAEGADGQLAAPKRFDAPGAPDGLRAGRSIRDVEEQLIRLTLDHFDGDKNAAAATLGISLKTLYNRLNEYAARDTRDPPT